MSLLLSVQELVKSFGPRPLFDGLTLDFRAGERIGLIGPNGAGKSTLLRILAGRDEPDAGNRTQKRNLRLGYLAQDDTFPAGLSVREVILRSLESESLEEHERETQTAIVLSQVGFRDPDQMASTLSGGWRKRLALARELAHKPEILLLDEPTNHLDLPGILWLERLLRGAPFGYIAATHDRAFLRAVADEVLEINRIYPEGFFRSQGNYETFLDRKEGFLEGQASRQESVANQVRRETEWLSHKARARTRKASSRIEAAADRREELAELKYRNTSAGTAGIDFIATGRQTRKLLEAKGISKSLGGRTLFRNVDISLSPGTKLGLLGPNGSGKSTLLKLLSGETPPDEGSVVPADRLRISMFEQGRASLDPETTLHEALCPNGEIVKIGDREQHVVARAKQFLFRAEQLNLPLSALSGGEQARVRIAQLMLQPADLLLLDEPTNDLDIPALEVLEASLEEFPGAVVLVSHDRELMDRICTEVVGLDGEGSAGSYANVSQWLTAIERSRKPVEKPASDAPAKAAPAPKPKAKKLNYREQQELAGMEAAILAADALVSEREAAVQAASTAGHVALTEACRALDEARQAVEILYARWQELEAKSTGG